MRSGVKSDGSVASCKKTSGGLVLDGTDLKSASQTYAAGGGVCVSTLAENFFSLAEFFAARVAE